MTKEFAERYFQWLKKQVKFPYRGSKDRDYEELLRKFHAREFTWIVPNDNNRIVDGLYIRKDFWGPGNPVPQTPVTTLEVLIGIARRLEWNGGGEAYIWAGQLLKNLGLQRFYNPLSKRARGRIDEVLDDLIWRTYEANGAGGFFPLANPQEDQRKVEIWYQMHAYLNENT